MKRDEFLTRPQSWTRTRRESFDPARYGCSVEGYKAARYSRWADVAMLLLAVVALALWAWGKIP